MKTPKSAFEDIGLISTVFLICVVVILAFVVYKLYRRLSEMSEELGGIRKEFFVSANQTPDIDEMDDLAHIQKKIEQIQKEQELLQKEEIPQEEEIEYHDAKEIKDLDIKEIENPLIGKKLEIIDED
tara:strand:- start:201 stop:581 length:381 start_codon:yes stop_codon:yes gene_type:complete